MYRNLTDVLHRPRLVSYIFLSPQQFCILLLQPSSLIGRRFLLIQTPQESPQACHFLLELMGWNWLSKVQARGFIG